MARRNSDRKSTDIGLAQSMRRVSGGPGWRVVQFGTALLHRHNSQTDRELRRLIQNDAQWTLLLRLTSFDRAHHMRVYRTLTSSGHTDPDLLLAALLHDVGKADERGRVHLVHRVLKVLLRSLSPRLLTSVSLRDGGWLRHGLFLARNHARLGADLVRDTGASERCARFIARHEDRLPVDDPALEQLIRADAEATA